MSGSRTFTSKHESRCKRQRRQARASLTVEELETRFVLSAVPGPEAFDPFMTNEGVTQTGPSIAGNKTLTKVTLLFSLIGIGEIRAITFGVGPGMVLMPVCMVVLATDSAHSTTQVGPVVAMDGPGNKFIAVWKSNTTGIRAALVTWNTCQILDQAVIDFTGLEPVSVGMRYDGTYVAAWVQTQSPGGAVARTFSSPGTPISSVIQLNPIGSSEEPVVAWTNHGDGTVNTDWNVVWHGWRPGSPFPQYGYFLQRYTKTGTQVGTTVLAIQDTNNPFTQEHIGRDALSNDPLNNVALASKQGPFGGDPGPGPGVRVRVFNGNLNPFPGLSFPIDTYPWNNQLGPCDSPTSANATELPAIDMNGDVNTAFSYFVVGTQQNVEGPKAHWAWFSRTEGWLDSGPIWDDIAVPCGQLVQDMFPSVAMNSAGNYWAIGWEVVRGPGPAPSGAGWLARAWDPPLESSDAQPVDTELAAAEDQTAARP